MSVKRLWTYLYWKHLSWLQRAALEGRRWRGWACCWWCSSAPCYTCRSCRQTPPTGSGWCSPQQTRLERNAHVWRRARHLLASQRGVRSIRVGMNLVFTRACCSADVQSMQAEFLWILLDGKYSSETENLPLMFFFLLWTKFPFLLCQWTFHIFLHPV